MILDVGCGTLNRNFPILKSNVINIDIQKTNFNKEFLDILCDAQYLPFRNEMFEIVYASHVMEHVFNPIQFLNELKRVSKRKVIIKVPRLTRKFDYYESHGHIFTWSKISLEHLLLLVFNNVEIYYSIRKHFVDLPFLSKTFNIFFFLAISILTNSNRQNELIAICRVDKKY